MYNCPENDGEEDEKAKLHMQGTSRHPNFMPPLESSALACFPNL